MRLLFASFAVALVASASAIAGPTGDEQVAGPRMQSAKDAKAGVLPGVKLKSVKRSLDNASIDDIATGSIGPVPADPIDRIALRQDGLALRGSIGTGFYYPVADSYRLRRLTETSLAPRMQDDGLRGTVESAVYSSYALRASLHDVRAAEKGVWRELMRFTPVISGELGVSISGSSFGELDSSSADRGRYGALSLSMPLLTGGERYFGFKAARSAALSAGYAATAERDGLVLDTVNSYLQNVYADTAANLYKRDEGRLLKLLASMKAQHRGGFVSGADVAEVQAELAARRQLLVEARAQASKSQQQVDSLAGRHVRIRGEFPRLQKALSIGFEPLLTRAMRRNARVMSAAHNAEASAYASKATYSRYLPRVGLTGQYRRDEEPAASDGEKDRWSVGIRLSVPLVDLSTAADISASKERASAERFRAMDTRRTVRTQFVNMWDDYQAGRASQQLARAKVEAQRKVAAASLARYEQGVTTLRNVLEDQRALTAADLDELQIDIRLTYTICQILLTADAFDTAMLAR